MYSIMKNKESVVIIMLLSSLFYGCSNHKVEVRTESDEVKMATSPYRVSLSVLGKIDEKLGNKNNYSSTGSLKVCLKELDKGQCSFEKNKNLNKIYENNPKLINSLSDELKKDGNISESSMNKIANTIGIKGTETKKYNKKTKKHYFETKIDQKVLNKLRKDLIEELDGNKFTIYSPIRAFRVSSIKNSSADTTIQNINLENVVKTALANVGKNVQVIHGNSMGKEYLVSGSITGFDKVFSKRSGQRANAYGGGGRGEFDIGMNNSDDDERVEITLDLFISKQTDANATLKVIPKVTSSNTLTLTKNSNSNGYSFSIMGMGVNFTDSTTVSDPLGYGTRLLVEKSLVELLAKLDNLDPSAFEIEKDKESGKIIVAKENNFIDFLWDEHLNEIYDGSMENKKEEYHKIVLACLHDLKEKEKRDVLKESGYDDREIKIIVNNFQHESLDPYTYRNSVYLKNLIKKVPQKVIANKLDLNLKLNQGDKNASK